MCRIYLVTLMPCWMTPTAVLVAALRIICRMHLVGIVRKSSRSKGYDLFAPLGWQTARG